MLEIVTSSSCPDFKLLVAFSKSSAATVAFCEKITFRRGLFSSITETLISLPTNSWGFCINDVCEFGIKPDIPSLVTTKNPPLVNSPTVTSTCSPVFLSSSNFIQTRSSLNLRSETTGLPKSDSGFRTATVTLSPNLRLLNKLLKILLSFSITSASVFAPISTKISEEFNLVITPVSTCPLETFTKLVLWAAKSSAMVCGLEEFVVELMFVFATH